MTLKASIKRFLNKRINPPYSIVSLGVNCFAKTFLIKHKFKKKKDAGELTLPFDYTFYTNAKYITEFIQNDFQEYFEEIYYVKESGYWGKARKIFFSHEKDFGENDKDKLNASNENNVSSGNSEPNQSDSNPPTKLDEDNQHGSDSYNPEMNHSDANESS